MKLRHLASIAVSNVDKKSVEGQTQVRLCNYTDVYNSPRIGADYEFTTATASSEQIRQYRLRRGDVLITKDSETPDDIGIPSYVTDDLSDVICGYHLAIIRPRPQVLDGRYLYWAIAAGPTRAQFSASAFGITRFGLRIDTIANATVPVPSLPQQRAIADFLDAETARIDRLVAKRQRMIELLDEKGRTGFVVALGSRGFVFPASLTPDWAATNMPLGWRIATLGVIVKELTNGYVGPTRDILRDSGIPYVQSLHIKNGRIEFQRRAYYVDADWHEARPRIHLRAGDVLIVQTGDIGQVAVVPEGFGEASCHALQIARVRPELCLGTYLGEYLRSPYGYQSLLSRASGALHPHLEGSIRDVPIVLPQLSEQESIVNDSVTLRAGLNRIARTLELQMTALVERRHAIITAAVTGQTPIQGAV